ncbi:hypothetical protein Tco_0154061 [Tanacetum coccineum]
MIQNTITESLKNVKNKSYRGAKEQRDLYDALVKSYQLDKYLFEFYGKTYLLKKDREDKDKDEDPPAGSDQGLKTQKKSKDAVPSKGSNSKESKSSSSKGTKSQLKSSGKSAQAEESMFKVVDTEMPHNQGSNLGNTDDQPNVEETSKHDCKIAHVEKPPLAFDELMSTPINFSAYVMNNLKIENLTQEHLVGPAFNLPKGTCRSRVELEYHFEDCFQVVPANYFFNNDLEYLKGGSSSRKYTTSTTKTKAAKYDDIQRIKEMLYKFKEGYFPRLNLRDIEDTLLLLDQNKISNLERYDIFDLNVALQMFIGCFVIQNQVSDISNMTPYTAYNNPQGIIYLDKLKRNRLMRSDELYKFCDGTLTSVRSVLHDIASNLRVDCQRGYGVN